MTNYGRRTENTTYQTSRTVKHTKLGQGAVKKLSLSILVDHSLRYDQGKPVVEPPTQRPRMNEALKVIMRLFTETEPITHESDWFTLREARLQLRPYTYPHMPVAVAAVTTLLEACSMALVTAATWWLAWSAA